MTGAEITQVVSVVIGAISVVVAAATVVFGVTAWRREFVGKRNIELAEEVLSLFYQAKDAIRYIRHPMVTEGEGSTRQPGPDETPAEKKLYDQVHVTAERYFNRESVFVRLHAIRYRFMARFGPQSAEPFDDLQGVVDDILQSGLLYGLSVKDRLYATDDRLKEKQTEDMKQHENVLWWHGKNDPISARVDATIQAMEAICQPLISTRSFW